MRSPKLAAQIIGTLFLLAFVSYLVGNILLTPTLEALNYLTSASANKVQLIIGLLLELLCAVAVIGIPATLLPIIGADQKSLAFWYLGCRAVEATLIFVGGLVLLALVPLSEAYLKASSSDQSVFQTLGTLLLDQHYWAYQLMSVAVGVGGLLFYTLLQRAKLVPRFLSVWGLLGYALLLLGAILELFDLKVGVLLAMPGGLNEIFLGVWLIVKGFNTNGVVTRLASSAKTSELAEPLLT
jgi:hypothetical protein